VSEKFATVSEELTIVTEEIISVLEEFKPGEKVPVSGIYRVTHDREHSQSHEVTCVENEPFPPCSRCSHPRYVLVRAAHHLDE